MGNRFVCSCIWKQKPGTSWDTAHTAHKTQDTGHRTKTDAALRGYKARRLSPCLVEMRRVL